MKGLRMGLKKYFLIILCLVPGIFSCAPGTQVNNQPGPVSTSSPTPAGPVKSSSPVPVLSPTPGVSPSIVNSPAASAGPTGTPVPLPTATPTAAEVDLNNSTGIYELRSHRTGDGDLFLVICDKDLELVGRQAAENPGNDVKFNDASDYKGTKNKFSQDSVTKAVTYTESLKQEYKNAGNPSLNTTYEWTFTYKQGVIYNLKQTVKNVGSSDTSFDYDPVLLSNSFNRVDLNGNFIESCSNYKK
jgi:hypothetical protein